eukprot:COSAG02_NODE_244_length_27402_cov_41.050397_15_plen_70_part_00
MSYRLFRLAQRQTLGNLAPRVIEGIRPYALYHPSWVVGPAYSLCRISGDHSGRLGIRIILMLTTSRQCY